MTRPIALCVIGTRPEVIKMAPVVRALTKLGFHAPILATAQHRDLLDQVLGDFELKATWDLDVMRPGQRLSELLSRLLSPLDEIIEKSKARVVLAQGDTTTVLAAALATYHCRIPFAHVEAGLRSGSLDAPFPEEGNRRLASVLANHHFAPTEGARAALVREGIDPRSIHVVGNTVIDALLGTAAQPDLPWPADIPFRLEDRIALVTLHRRESFGSPMELILGALREFALRHPDTRVIYPVHPNPNVLGPARRILGGLRNVHLIQPVGYGTFVNMLRRCHAVFTDSGGIQEEAPALGKPVLLFRTVTERPEAVAAGGVELVGSDPDLFNQKADALWADGETYSRMAQRRFPYGDGSASSRIAEVLDSIYGAREQSPVA